LISIKKQPHIVTLEQSRGETRAVLPHCDSHSIADAVARIQNQPISNRQAGDHFHEAAVPITDLDERNPRAAFLDEKDGPTVILSEQSNQCNHYRVVAIVTER
jgi:hypothetical protein